MAGKKNPLTSLIYQKYPEIRLQPWQFGGLWRIYSICENNRLDPAQMVDLMPTSVRDPYLYLKAVVTRQAEDARTRKLQRVLNRRAKAKEDYYATEDY